MEKSEEDETDADMHPCKSGIYPSQPCELSEFCEEFFFDLPYSIVYQDWGGEAYSAKCGYFSIFRTELFNPDEENGKLCYIVNAGGDGMSLSMDFVYDSTGKYALVYWGNDDLDSGCLRFLDFAID